jgi:LmbE family N-acetylglucosaminyl deacetylase
MRRGRRATFIVLGIVGVLIVIAAGLRILAPRAMQPARAADPVAAKAAGEALLASRDTTALIVVAHPDDTEWWAGGTAAMLAKHDHVVLVVATSGEKGDSGLVADLGAKREQLQRDGGALLGYSEIVFLREPDGGLTQAADFPARVAEAFSAYRPSIVITFDTEREAAGYHHVDHEAAGRVTTQVARDRGGVTLYLMHTSAPDVICDYAPVKDAKARAFAILTSYHDLVPLMGPLQKALAGLLGSSAPVYGSKASYPGVGIEYGEVFRKVVVPVR